MKNRRQEKILEIISQHPIETQDELIAKLAECGFRCAQSTISRDIKQLHLVKDLSNGTYRYVVSKNTIELDSSDRMQRILHECCTSCDYAQNLVVLKTMPGLASAAGAALDAMDIPAMVGCVCGDDTVVIIMRDESSALELCGEINLICK